MPSTSSNQHLHIRLQGVFQSYYHYLLLYLFMYSVVLVMYMSRGITSCNFGIVSLELGVLPALSCIVSKESSQGIISGWEFLAKGRCWPSMNCHCRVWQSEYNVRALQQRILYVDFVTNRIAILISMLYHAVWRDHYG